MCLFRRKNKCIVKDICLQITSPSKEVCENAIASKDSLKCVFVDNEKKGCSEVIKEEETSKSEEKKSTTEKDNKSGNINIRINIIKLIIFFYILF